LYSLIYIYQIQKTRKHHFRPVHFFFFFNIGGECLGTIVYELADPRDTTQCYTENNILPS
jgi:hypothetical protein